MENSFTAKLNGLTKSKQNRSLNGLLKVFENKSFAVLFMLLMAIPALPLPTGGVTHIFELIVMLLALEMIAGRSTIWLPKRFSRAKLPDKFWTKTLPVLVRLINKFERFSRPRLSGLLSAPLAQRLVGIIVLGFAICAFLAPPFSWLDTLPSLGIVIISLALIFEDTLALIAGLIIGSIGIGLVIFIGEAVFQLL